MEVGSAVAPVGEAEVADADAVAAGVGTAAAVAVRADGLAGEGVEEEDVVAVVAAAGNLVVADGVLGSAAAGAAHERAGVAVLWQGTVTGSWD